MCKCTLLLEPPDFVFFMLSKRHLRFGGLLNSFLGEADELVSRGFKDQFHSTFKTLLPIGQVCLLSATVAPEMLGLTTNFLRVVVLVSVEKAALTLEGIRQFYVAIEKEE